MLATEFVGDGFFGPRVMFGVFLRVEPLRDRHQRGRKLLGAHLAKDCHVRPERHLHARRDLRYLQGQVVHRELLLHVPCTVRRAQRAFHERHHVVRDHGDTEPKQRSLGIAQRVDLTREIHGQMLKASRWSSGPRTARSAALPGASATGRLVRYAARSRHRGSA